MKRCGNLEGRWTFVDGKVLEDAICREIKKLTSIDYVEVAQDQSGWIRLFQDPMSGEYWELDYPQSGSHGAGPPRLRRISEPDVSTRYGLKLTSP
jgi:Immunity protein 27